MPRLTVDRLAAACVAARTERLYGSYLADESQTSPEHIGLIDKCIWTVCIVCMTVRMHHVTILARDDFRADFPSRPVILAL